MTPDDLAAIRALAEEARDADERHRGIHEPHRGGCPSGYIMVGAATILALLAEVDRLSEVTVRDVVTWEAAERDTRARLREAVCGLPTHLRRNGWATGTAWVSRRAVLALFDEGGEA